MHTNKKHPSQSNRIRLLGYFLIVILPFGAMEIGAYFIGKNIQKKTPYLFAEFDQQIALENYETYMAERHEELGWPLKQWIGTEPYDESGSRITPEYPVPGGACVSLYGDSYTFGDDVDHEYTWGNQLAKQLGCRVANYGLGGYGTDQAMLRFKINTQDEAPLVILAIWPENVIRNLNQYRTLLDGGKGDFFTFKPRFVIKESGELSLIPLPSLSKVEFIEVLNNPASHLKYETFLPAPWRFPYTYSLTMALMDDRFWAGRSAIPWWFSYFKPDHPSHGLAIMIGIIERFQQLAEKRGKTPLVILISTVSVSLFQQTGRWPYQSLLDLASERSIHLYNLGPDIVNYLGERHICEIMRHPETCAGHFGNEGYGLIADLVYQHIDKSGLIGDNVQ